jgi:ParB family transcriptional regulator, chromosome partitioning protein
MSDKPAPAGDRTSGDQAPKGQAPKGQAPKGPANEGQVREGQTPKGQTPRNPAVRHQTPRLGRGLAALFGETQAPGGAGATMDDIRRLPIDLLDPNPFQPRMNFDEESLRDLAESIRAHGLLQPILVRPNPDTPDRYQIVAGERRWRAAGASGLHEIPVVCRELSDPEAAAAALIENLQRENLNPIEEAEGYQRLVQNFGLTHGALGTAVSKSRGHVGNIMRLLTLPEPVRDEVRKGALSLGHARALLTLPDPAKIAPEVMKKGLSVRQTERLAQRILSENNPAKRAEPPRAAAAADTEHVERDLAMRTGYRVKVTASPRGDGSLTIWFNDLFQLDDLIARLTGANQTLEEN